MSTTEEQTTTTAVLSIVEPSKPVINPRHVVSIFAKWIQQNLACTTFIVL
jgi:hypothetical protein